MPEYTSKADRINELPNKELEMNFYLLEDISIDHVAEIFFDTFRVNSEIYVIAANLPHISESKTQQLRYAKKKKSGDDTRLYVISIRDRDGFITLKRKGPKTYQKNVVIRDEQEEVLPYTQWTQYQEDEMKAVEAERIGIDPIDIFLSKETDKRKLKIRIINTTTYRAYTVGVNEKHTTTGSIEKTIGIEYIGREPGGNMPVDSANALNEIIADIASIGNIIRMVCKRADIKFKVGKRK